MCVEWRVVGLPGPSATGALRPGLEHFPVGVPPHGPQRERAYPGQHAAPQPVPMNPARRAPRRPAFKQATPASVPSPGPTPAGPVDLGNAEAIARIMTALESMGLLDMLLQQVRSSIPPAPAVKTKDVPNEKRLANLGSKINILEQQSAKLSKQMRRLEEEFLATRAKLDEKTVELENAKTEYRFLRDTGKFTPTKFVSPAASLNGDDDDINAPGDTAETMEGVGSGEAGGSNDPILGGVEAGDMDVSGSAPIQTRATGGLGKRRCLEFVAPSVDLLTAGFWAIL